MPNFTLQKIEAIRGKQAFFTLKKDGDCQFTCYENEIKLEGNYSSELRTIYALMDLVSNMQMLPKEKFKDVTPKGETVKEYEFKTKHLRVYAIHIEHTGKVIILGGYKNTQPSDFSRFRSLKQQYIDFLNSSKPKQK